MPIGPERLPVKRAAAEPPGLPPAARTAEERGVNAVPAGLPPSTHAEADRDPVEPSREAQGALVEGGRRGARSFRLRKEKKRERKPAREEKKPPDPAGRGRSLDVQA